MTPTNPQPEMEKKSNRPQYSMVVSFKSLIRFIKKVNKTPTCWNFTGTTTNDYGHRQLKVNYRTFSAHKFSYLVFRGPVLDGLLVLHTCDNPACVNPEHLYLGTPKDNMDDMMRKNRHRHLMNNPEHRIKLKEGLKQKRAIL